MEHTNHRRDSGINIHRIMIYRNINNQGFEANRTRPITGCSTVLFQEMMAHITRQDMIVRGQIKLWISV